MNHVKENDLAHGEFGKWLEKVKINQSTANKMMKIVKKLPNSYTYTNLGLTALDLIATLPDDKKQEQIEKPMALYVELPKPYNVVMLDMLTLRNAMVANICVNYCLVG